MSSVERDIAEYALSVYRDAVGLNFDEMSKEELINHIEAEAMAAKEAYMSFALAYGWYDSRKEAEEDLEPVEEHAEPESEKPLTFLHIREWLAKDREIEPYLIGTVERETKKAIHFKAIDSNGFWDWLPKSMIIERINDL